jgi:hypothetical protein
MAKSKRRTNLERLMTDKNAENTYTTTYEDCVKWIRILNRELFSGYLPPVEDIDIRWRRKTLAYYTYFIDTENPRYKKHILCMNKRYKSKRFFVEVLAHELVHHYQFYHDEPMGHGPSFTCWRDLFNKKGLSLAKTYEDEE